MPSAIASAEDALRDLLLGDVTLAGIAGPPQLTEPQTPRAEHVWIYETVTDATQSYDVSMNDPGIKDETFVLRVAVFVTKHQAANQSDEQAFVATRDRLDELADVVENVVRSNSYKGAGAPWFSAQVEKIDRFAAMFDNIRGLLKVLDVRIDYRPL